MKTKAFIVRLVSPNVVKEISRVISSNKFLSKMTDLNIFALATQKYTIVPCQLLASLTTPVIWRINICYRFVAAPARKKKICTTD